MKYRFLSMLVALLVAITVSAQSEEKNYPHAFAGVQGGVTYPYNGAGIDRKWSPLAGVSVGYYFTEVFGLRLQGNGSLWNAKLPDGSEYKSKSVGIDLDMLFNLSNVFFPNRNNLVNVVAVAGAPFNLAVPHTWVLNYAQATSEGSHKWNTAWKIGGQLDFNISKCLGFNIEAGTNYVRQRNKEVHDNNKWWPYAMAGITYKFGYKKSKVVAPVATPVVEEVEEQPVAEVAPAKPVVVEKKPEPKPVVKPAPAKTTENLYFKIGRSNITKEQASKIDGIAQWAKEHPTATIALTGYADKGTGTTTINQALSEKRAAAVKDALVKKGVAADRIVTDAKGDTVQPFTNNDDNRAVIVLGEEK